MTDESSNLIKPRTLSGFRDFLPREAIIKSRMIHTLEQVFQSFGFVPIETPHLEYDEILVGAGEEINKQIYRFVDQGGRKVALRFDQTVPLARYVVQHWGELGLPFKRYAIGNVFRGERAQAGRYREFTQCDFDFIGSTSILSDLEIIQVINRSLSALGVQEFTIRFNNRKILSGLLAYLEVTPQADGILRLIDKLDKVGLDAIRQALAEELALTPHQVDHIIQFINNRAADPCQFLAELQTRYNGLHPLLDEGLRELQQLHTLLTQLDIPQERYQIDLAIARGLSYYTGIVYETILNQLPQMGSVCSGGRYDNLTKTFSKEPMSGVGASIGLDRLLAALEQLKLTTARDTTAHILLANLTEDAMSYLCVLAEQLRQSGLDVEIYPDCVKKSKQTKYADRKGHRYVVSLESNAEQQTPLVSSTSQALNAVFAIKDMRSGEQWEATSVAEILKIVKDS